MITWLIKKVIGSKNTRMVKALKPTVDRINALELEYQQLSDDQLRAKTAAWQERLSKIEDPNEQQRVLNEILPEVFAAVKNAARRMVGSTFTVCDQPYTWNMVHFDVQLIGGICLHRGTIAEMATGEGKTLVATLPLFLNALTGRGAHLVTTNDYLARRDGETMGEVFFRGNVVMKGYLKNPKATEEALKGGWFHSGDLGVWHEDGYIELKDRSKDIIISGGENISTIEVESVLYKHPAVMEAAVVARPDEHWGETPCAFVTLKTGATPPTAAEIIAFCRENMAHYKAPRSVVFGELPKTSTGKIQKFVLRERARAL